MRVISTPFSMKIIEELRVGDQVSLSGVVYTARDAAHKRMVDLLDDGKPLPFNFDSQAVYYAGPCPAPPGKPIGSVGPTTSSRMDKYSPRLIEVGLRVMIGKGSRSDAVIDSIRKHKGIYLTAIGGAGAFYSRCVESAELIAFEDFGTEAIHKLVVRDMPLVVAIV